MPAHETADAIRIIAADKSSIKDIMDQGLHEFLEDFITRNNQLWDRKSPTATGSISIAECITCD